VIRGLSELLPDIKEAQTTLAFEFEPSSLMALGSLEAVEYFCQRVISLRCDDPRWTWVGLNLDIPHFCFIARKKPSEIPQVVLDCIVHAHISIHTSGHLADGILEDTENADSQRRKRTCLAWLMLIEGLAEKKQHSTIVSLELECAKTRSQVSESFRILQNWLSLLPNEKNR